MNGNKKLLWLKRLLLCIGLFILIGAIYIKTTDQNSNIDFPSVSSFKPMPECNNSLVTVLSIDGGGVRGIIPAFFLNKIEKDTHKPISKMFDVMSGVSTGSILIAGLTTPNEKGNPKYTAEDIIQFYEHDAQHVFSSSLLHRIFSLGGLIGPKYESTSMQRVTQQYFADTALSNLLSNVLIFGYDVKRKGLIAFLNHRNNDVNVPDYKVKDIIDGTTAMMSYFPPKSLYDDFKKLRHVVADAGIMLNNPTAMAFLYAQTYCPNAHHYLVISMGTGTYPKVNIEPKSWGLLRFLPEMFVITMEGEVTTANLIMEKIAVIANDNNANTPIPKILYIRLSPAIDIEDSDPADSSPQNLSALTGIADQYYVKNKSLFNCLYQVLTNHSLDNISQSCIDMLKKEPQVKTSIYLNLEG